MMDAKKAKAYSRRLKCLISKMKSEGMEINVNAGEVYLFDPKKVDKSVDPFSTEGKGVGAIQKASEYRTGIYVNCETW